MPGRPNGHAHVHHRTNSIVLWAPTPRRVKNNKQQTQQGKITKPTQHKKGGKFESKF
jgi:hypothetical protein